METLIPAIVQVVVYLILLVIITKYLGIYMAQVFQGQRNILSPMLVPVERGIYRLFRIDPKREQTWTAYTSAMLAYSVLGLLLTYLIMRVQQWLPWNPQNLGPASPDLSFNTSASFTTNTNWQSYVPETTVTYFTNMVGLATHNFTSAAVGIVLAVGLIRGFARRETKALGNFWVDLTRCTLYVLLPLSIVIALVYVSQGAIQNLNPYQTVHTLQGGVQSIVGGPFASQEAIKELGTNGGGPLNANSAHPFENPNGITNFIQMLAIFAISSALTYAFGRMVGNQRQGWALWFAMTLIFLGGLVVAAWAEQAGNPLLTQHARLDQIASALQSGGNMEGKEVRFGIYSSALYATITTDASNGAVNAMHDSFTPIGGVVPLTNIALGEIVFGGVGSGLYGMLVWAVLAVFIAGLMVGRTPEYLGKKIQQYDMKMVTIAILILPLSILGFTALAMLWPGALDSRNNLGPHGLSEILYAFTSGTGNNGSAFAGLNANTPFYNLTIGLAMIIGRFAFIVPVMALAGSLAAKKRAAATSGTFPTTGPLFVGLLVGVILIVGALTYFPVYALGPIVEHLQMLAGKTF
jgi:potassium-transporting ATPase potassium-binding subunit